MEIKFSKMHGTLNDFVVWRDDNSPDDLPSSLVARICNRREGVGADGVIVVRKSEKAAFFMDYRNSDGSLAEMCGNGIRCLAKYVRDQGLTDQSSFLVETRAGVRAVEVSDWSPGGTAKVRVDMGPPIFDPDKVPVRLEPTGAPILDCPIETGDRSFKASFVSMGNPHCVIFVDGEEVEDYPRLFGPALEIHPLFPAKTNVEFVRVLSRKRIVMRVWERGCGETFACGTGACASAVAAKLKGLVEDECEVALLGGDLIINWKELQASVFMTGPAVTAFYGTLTI
ncbi:MAG: diaminopimelate epimerase [Pseudomonadota bacterium]